MKILLAVLATLALALTPVLINKTRTSTSPAHKQSAFDEALSKQGCQIYTVRSWESPTAKDEIAGGSSTRKTNERRPPPTALTPQMSMELLSLRTANDVGRQREIHGSHL